jgi:hypothetical protein
VLIDAHVDPAGDECEIGMELARCAGGGGGVEDGPGLGQRGVDVGIAVLARAPFLQEGLGGVPTGVAACREGLADAGGSEAETDVALTPDRVGELGEPSVFLGRDERSGGPAASSVPWLSKLLR